MCAKHVADTVSNRALDDGGTDAVTVGGNAYIAGQGLVRRYRGAGQELSECRSQTVIILHQRANGANTVRYTAYYSARGNKEVHVRRASDLAVQNLRWKRRTVFHGLIRLGDGGARFCCGGAWFVAEV